MAKILFVSDNLLNEGLGIMYLSSYVKMAGHKVELLLLADFKSIDQMITSIEEFAPDLVAFSVMTPQAEQFRSVSNIIKKKTGRTIAWGGPHCMFMAEDVMTYGCVDIICTGEGEEALFELMNRIEAGEDYEDVHSLCVKTDAGWVRNPLGKLADDLDKYPFPDRDLYYAKYPLLANFAVKRLITSRGCPYKCSYCFEPSFFKMYKGNSKVVRRHSPDYVIGEIKNILKKYPTRHIHFSDDIFNLNKRWLKEFGEKYRSNISQPFTCNIELTSIDEEIIKLLKDGGCRGGIFGLESGVENTRINILNKKITNARYIEATALLRKHKFKFMMNIMFCLPNESLDDAIESFRFANSLKSDGLRISILKMYKGTELAKFATANGLSEGVGEFTYKARDVHHEFDKILNVQWAAILFSRIPFLLRFARPILSQKWTGILKPLQAINHWEDIRFFHIPLWQAWQYFWESRDVFIGGMAQAQKDTYEAEDGSMRPAAELFYKPKGVIDWSGDRGQKETYVPIEEDSGFSTMKAEILEALRPIKHPRRDADVVSLGLVTVSDAIDGDVVISVMVESGEKVLMEQLAKQMKEAVLALDGVFTAQVKYSYKLAVMATQ